MRVLVTGGAGFIGSNLVVQLLEHGHEVTVIDDLSTGYQENLADLDVRFYHASILDSGALTAAVAGADSVVHLAALGSVPRSIENPQRTHEVNSTGTLAVLEAARSAGATHVISASSSSVYGMNPELPKRERSWVRPMSPYAVSKLATEQYTLAYQQSYGMETLAFRFFNVYGPRQRPGHAYAAVIPVFLHEALKRQPLPIHGDGTQSRDFTYVTTVCTVIRRAVERRIHSAEPVNLAYGTNTHLNALISLIEEHLGHPVERARLEPRAGDVRASMADNTRVSQLFPEVAPVDLHTGLSQTLAWMRTYMGLQ